MNNHAFHEISKPNTDPWFPPKKIAVSVYQN